MKTHIVKSGDTLSEIAEKYGTTITALREANADKIRNSHLIQIGWVLKIPEGSDTVPNELSEQFKKALNDIGKLDSVQKLAKMLGE